MHNARHSSFGKDRKNGWMNEWMKRLVFGQSRKFISTLDCLRSSRWRAHSMEVAEYASPLPNWRAVAASCTPDILSRVWTEIKYGHDTAAPFTVASLNACKVFDTKAWPYNLFKLVYSSFLCLPVGQQCCPKPFTSLVYTLYKLMSRGKY